MAEFAGALQKTLEHEGVRFDAEGQPIPGKTGYVNDPADPGGETNYGVIRRVAVEQNYAGAMADIPYSKVLLIYRAEYWQPMMGDDIQSQKVAEEVFDTGVNCGVGTAVRFLQESLNLLNNNGEKYPDIVADGRMGPSTLAMLHTALKLGGDFEVALLKSLNGMQFQRYREICEANPKRERFFRGWLLGRVA